MLNKILNLGLEISKEHDYKKLFGIFVKGAMDIANCDAGTLYQYKLDEADGIKKLFFVSTRNMTLKQESGLNGEEVNLPPVLYAETNACSYSAIHRCILNVSDVYNDDNALWKGPKFYDSKTGYHTQSVLVIPLIDKNDELIGVLQLINAKDDNGNIIAFSKEIEHVINSLSSQVAIILSNMLLTLEIENLLNSMIEALTTAIDSRTPYNANHTRMVTRYCDLFMEYLNSFSDIKFTKDEMDVLHMGAMLHDVGKMVVPENILNKPTRLDEKLDRIKDRFEIVRLKLDVLNLEGKLDNYEEMINLVNSYYDTIVECNTVGFISDEKMAIIDEISNTIICGVNLLTDDEIEDLHIRKGTLTLEERKVIEDHVVYTNKILKNIRFGKKYSKALDYASAHHEFLNGSGYPNKCTSKDLPIPVRILTMMDVFESLTATDRPYKKPMSKEKAYSILREMVKEGKLDETLVNIFGEALNNNILG